MELPIDVDVRIAPPDRAAAILTARGYPIGAKTLRTWYKQGKIAGCFTGKRVLLHIDRVIDYLEAGDPIGPGQSESGGAIRRVGE